MPFEEDLDSFLDPVSGFAQTATVGGVSVTGIFDNGFAGNSGSQFGVESTSPSFTCKQADLTAGFDEETTVVINGVTYTVRDPQPDGTGMITLTLRKS